MRRRSFLVLALLVSVACGTVSQAEVVQNGGVRVAFSGTLKPHALPRKGVAPIAVAVGGRISTADGSDPPPLQRIEISINRNGRLDPGAVASCSMAKIQPATTPAALRACPGAKVGDGSFSASVALPGQAPFPSQGDVTVFNGRRHGHPEMLVHIYGMRPIPVSLTVPLRIQKGRGNFGIVLRGDLPAVGADAGFVKGLRIRILGGSGRGGRHYLTAGCPAPSGYSLGIFPLVRAGFSFGGSKTLQQTLTRSCRAIG